MIFCGRTNESETFAFDGAATPEQLQFDLDPDRDSKEVHGATQKGDVATMTQLFSSKAIQKLGADTIRSNNEKFAETARRASSAGGTYRMENIEETSSGDGKQVSFFYKNDKGTDSIELVFALSKEGGVWQIDLK